MSTYQHILVERDGKLLVIKFNNPRKKNALNRTAYKEITKILQDAAKDNSVSVCAITGVGDFYSSGNDLQQSSEDPNDDFDEVLQQAKVTIFNLVRAFYEFPKLLISCVNGPCIGIAATTAALCDVVYCSDTAYFYTPFTLLGLCPEGCSSYTFPAILGRSKANEMLLFNHKMTAEEALRFNFVSEIYKKDEFETKLWPKIREISNLPAESLKTAKKLVSKFRIEQLEKANQAEVDALHQCWYSDEFTNAISNFLSRKSKL